MDDNQPYVIERAGLKGRIRLGAEAKWWAKEHGRTLPEMAKYLLARQHFGEGDVETPLEHQADDSAADQRSAENLQRYEALSGVPSENVEDRRDETYEPDLTMRSRGLNPAEPSPQAQSWSANPLANAAGFLDVGKSPAPAPPYLGPTQPRWPEAFGKYEPQSDEPLPF